MSDNLDIFYSDFLNAPETYEVRANGVPLEILDKLSPDEKIIAEEELIKKIRSDSWAIAGLVKLKSNDALVSLYSLLAELPEEYNGRKIKVAHAIYLICQDEKMVEVFLEEIPKQIYYVVLGDALRKCSVFNDNRIVQMLKKYSDHKDISVCLGAREALKKIQEQKI
jgi:hypothetical protein